MQNRVRTQCRPTGRRRAGIGVVVALLLAGCTGAGDVPALPTRGFFMGTLPSMAAGQGLDEACAQVAEHAEFVPVWASGVGAVGFWDYAGRISRWQGAVFLSGCVRGNAMFPIINFSFIDAADGCLVLKTPAWLPDATLSDPRWRALYKKSVLDVVRIVRPAFLSLGNEVNRWYEACGAAADAPNGFQHFVSLYADIYDAVKAMSPATAVFCVFAREIVDEHRPADMSVLRLFDGTVLDLLVLTTYPFAVVGVSRPEDIPADYYSAAAQYLPGKPFGFSEIGWSSLDAFGGPQSQADFLRLLATDLTRDQGADLRLFGYCWLHDLQGGDSTGLIDSTGVEKKAYAVWKELSAGS